MAGNQVAAEGLAANIAGISKSQLYEIMSQMKTLIEQNQQQARQMLIQNPLLTKALCQAQIMLGMVKPPQMRSSQPPRQSNIQPSQLLPGQVGLQEQAAPSQNQPHVRKQHQNQTGMQISVASVAAANLQSQPMPSHSLQTPQQTKGHLNPPVSLPRTSQLPNVPPVPLNLSSQPPHHHHHQTPMLTSSSQMQQSLQTTGFPHMPLHPPMQPLVQMLVSSTLVPSSIFHGRCSIQVINLLLSMDLCFHKDSHHMQIRCHLNQHIKLRLFFQYLKKFNKYVLVHWYHS